MLSTRKHFGDKYTQIICVCVYLCTSGKILCLYTLSLEPVRVLIIIIHFKIDMYKKILKIPNCGKIVIKYMNHLIN